eukprot:TRINITY_DN15505_c0_g1_i1.p1 TRINITY_DN15505_c0_g1~~TRINITY_DN15505_c0_g1_i1.p1  ORF type:complete len:195 (-),score=26.99 TRINITY_DN15505_c0_g1_i1:335-868(-)
MASAVCCRAPRVFIPRLRSLGRLERTATTDTAAGSKLRCNFFLSAESPQYYDDPVEMVVLPGVEGYLGVLRNHVPMMAELRPGVVSVHEVGGTVTKWFVSGGFAFIDRHILDVMCIDGAKLEHLEPGIAKSGLEFYTNLLSETITDPKEKAEAQIGRDVHRAMCHALGVPHTQTSSF